MIWGEGLEKIEKEKFEGSSPGKKNLKEASARKKSIHLRYFLPPPQIINVPL